MSTGGEAFGRLRLDGLDGDEGWLFGLREAGAGVELGVWKRIFWVFAMGFYIFFLFSPCFLHKLGGFGIFLASLMMVFGRFFSIFSSTS